MTSPSALTWQFTDGGTRITSTSNGTCGDVRTAIEYATPQRLSLTSDTGLQRGTTLLGLEAEPYDYVPAQVDSFDKLTTSPAGWELVLRHVMNSRASPNRFGIHEVFLRRLDQPKRLFRYSDDLCNADGTPTEPPARQPGLTFRLPPEIPHVEMHRQGDYVSAQQLIERYTADEQPTVRVVWLELGTSDEILSAHSLQDFPPLIQFPDQVIWVVVQALGDQWGPHRRGHEYGSYSVVDAKGGGSGAWVWCLDLITSN